MLKYVDRNLSSTVRFLGKINYYVAGTRSYLIMLLISLFIMSCPGPGGDPGTPITCEVDFLVKIENEKITSFVPENELMGSLLEKVTKDLGDADKRCLIELVDEALPFQELTWEEAWTFCLSHHNHHDEWVVYVLGMDRFTDEAHKHLLGYAWVYGSPTDPNDFSVSAVCVGKIKERAGPHGKEAELNNSTTAHELCHQFHLIHCLGLDCIMYDYGITVSDPEDELCDNHEEELKINKP